MNIKNKSILVTGGAGCVGSNIVKKLDGRGAKITVIDNLSAYPCLLYTSDAADE